MDILEIGIPRDRPVRDIRGQPLQSPDELPDLVFGQEARATERAWPTRGGG